jgi:hypothetical protein
MKRACTLCHGHAASVNTTARLALVCAVCFLTWLS